MQSAALWIEQMIAGSLATMVATIALAFVGLAIIAGRLPLRRGAEVVLGICIIFGAPAIARGLSASPTPEQAEPLPPPSTPPVAVKAPSPAVYDPYAGASVPQAQTSSGIFASGR